jgi:hypothetical protein
MQHEHMFAMVLFAIAAVAVIIYQHASATAQVIGTLGGSTGTTPESSAGTALGYPASLAGTPTIGQSGSATAVPVVPINTNPGYTIQ